MVEAGAGGTRAGDLALENAEDYSSIWAGNDDESAAIDEHADPLRALQQCQRHAALNAAFDALEEAERFVIEAIYKHSTSLRVIGETLGIERVAVSRMQCADRCEARLRCATGRASDAMPRRAVPIRERARSCRRTELTISARPAIRTPMESAACGAWMPSLSPWNIGPIRSSLFDHEVGDYGPHMQGNEAVDRPLERDVDRGRQTHGGLACEAHERSVRGDRIGTTRPLIAWAPRTPSSDDHREGT